MKNKFFLIVSFIFIGISAFCQGSYNRNIIADRFCNDLYVEKTIDSCYLVLSSICDSAIYYLPKHEINNYAFDLYIRKISHEGKVLWGKRFFSKQYEHPIGICKAQDGLYILSVLYNSDNIKHNGLLKVRKLDLKGTIIYFDTTYFSYNNYYNNKAFGMKKGGLCLIYLDSFNNEENERQKEGIYIKHMDGDGKITYSRLIDSDYFEINENIQISKDNGDNIIIVSSKRIFDTNDIKIKTYNIGNKIICHQKIKINTLGDVLNKYYVNHRFDFEINNNRYAYLGQTSIQFDKLGRYDPRFEGRYDYIYRIRFYITDSLMNKIIEKILVQDTSKAIFGSEKAFQVNDGFIISANFFRNNTASLCIWKLDNNANILWKTWYEDSPYSFSDFCLIEENYGYNLFCSTRNIMQPNKFGKGLYMLKIDKNGNIIN